MASRLPDGSIQMADGRILYANSVILAADLLEILPLVTPPPAWPFISGGGGGGAGTPGARGADGAPGAPGAQGPQGTNPGVQGPQGVAGVQGNQGLTGSGLQGPIGNQGFQGPLGPQGNQGFQGLQGPQGFQGSVGSGAQGIQGFQGSSFPNYQETEFTGGGQSISLGVYVDIVGTTLGIVTVAPGFVRFDGRATINAVKANPGPVTGAACAVAINVDGTDYPIGIVQMSGLQVTGGNSENLDGIACGWKTISLAAGAHTAKLRAKAIIGTSTVLSTADAPSVVAATW